MDLAEAEVARSHVVIGPGGRSFRLGTADGAIQQIVLVGNALCRGGEPGCYLGQAVTQSIVGVGVHPPVGVIFLNKTAQTVVVIGHAALVRRTHGMGGQRSVTHRIVIELADQALRIDHADTLAQGVHARGAYPIARVGDGSFKAIVHRSAGRTGIHCSQRHFPAQTIVAGHVPLGSVTVKIGFRPPINASRGVVLGIHIHTPAIKRLRARTHHAPQPVKVLAFCRGTRFAHLDIRRGIDHVTGRIRAGKAQVFSQGAAGLRHCIGQTEGAVRLLGLHAIGVGF